MTMMCSLLTVDLVFVCCPVLNQAKHILSQQRSRMTPLLFETILFLKINDWFWDMETVAEAISMAAAEDASERLRKKEQEELPVEQE